MLSHIWSISDVTNDEALALRKLGFLSAQDLIDLAGRWMMTELNEISPGIAILASELDHSVWVVEPMFERILKELDLTEPSFEAAVRTVLKLYLRAIVDGRVPVGSGVAEIHASLFHRVREFDTRFVLNPHRRAADNVKCYGEQIGMETVFPAYIDLLDAQQGPPQFHASEEKQDRFREEMFEAVMALYQSLQNDQEAVGTNRAVNP